MGGALTLAPASLAQSTAADSAAFQLCAPCHSLDGSNGTGPTLKGVIGRLSGTVPGFRYSRAMKSAAITWDATSLDRYLADPQALVPGNIMPFSGIQDAATRDAVIVYLRSLR
ncbi:MAG: c-type cytochrome [Steroidobacteraceae bacterium]